MCKEDNLLVELSVELILQQFAVKNKNRKKNASFHWYRKLKVYISEQSVYGTWTTDCKCKSLEDGKYLIAQTKVQTKVSFLMMYVFPPPLVSRLKRGFASC